MSGHSKWHNIKIKKGKMDAIKGNIFSKVAREIMVSARAGSNPELNYRLRLAIDKAKSVNMPSENIERAIKKGSGEVGGVNYEEFLYEGYGPNGVAIMVEGLTDNKNRSISEIRSLFSKNGGSLGDTGCVSWMFSSKGVIEVPLEVDEDTLINLALEYGAEDVTKDEDCYRVYTKVQELYLVKSGLEKEKIPITKFQIERIPQNTVRLSGDSAIRTLKFLDLLEDHSDVQNVYSNFDMDTEEMKKIDL